MKSVREKLGRLLPCPNEFEIRLQNYTTRDRHHIYSVRQQLAEERELSEVNLQTLEEVNDVLEGMLSDITTSSLDEIATAKVIEIAQIRGNFQARLDMLKSFISDATSGEASQPIDPVEDAKARVGKLACSRCGGVIIDPATGYAYCGRTGPSQVSQQLE